MTVDSPSTNSKGSAKQGHKPASEAPPASQSSGLNALTAQSEDEFLNDQAQAMRAGVYELLGRLLSAAPDQAVLDVLRGIDDVDASEGQVAMGWELMKQSAQKADVESVRDEYNALFIGVGRGELVPFGSWYVTGFLMEKPLALLRTDLQELGIARQDGVRESEDHIAALCDAMAIIIRSGSEISLHRQQQFFKDHIEPWAATFFGDLQTAKSAHFYRSVGFFGDGFIGFETRLLSMQN